MRGLVMEYYLMTLVNLKMKLEEENPIDPY